VWRTYSGDARFIYGGSTTTAVQLSSIVGGQNTLCSLSVTNALYCLGSNSNWSLGTGDNILYTAPTFKQLHGDLDGKTITQISVNAIHGCAIADSKVYCWGYQQNGAIGNNGGGSLANPGAVYDTGVLAGKTMTTVMAAGTGGVIGGITVYAHTCALDDAGNAYCWGANGNNLSGGGQLGNGSVGGGNANVPGAVVGGLQFKQGEIVGGSWHTCAIRTNGKLYCWGADNNGQIGNAGSGGSTVTHTGTPSQVQGTSILDLEYAGQTFNDITAGQAHNCAISAENKMWCWGQNAQGQLGIGSTTDSQVARKVTLPSGETGWKKVAAGNYWTCALTLAGHVYCWGGAGLGGPAPWIGDGNTAGTPRTSPTAVLTSGVLAGKTLDGLWCTYSTTIVRDTDGKFYAWGRNDNGMLGTGSSSTPDTAVPIQATYLNTFSITTGGSNVVIPF
jgi:alpha-tubulin suppressor-like RCC1 family protein